MIKYALPGMYEHAELYFNLLDLKQNKPEYFYPDVKIEIVYGNPQFCIWDGGRIFEHYRQTTIEEMKSIIYTYNNVFNTPIRYVFTNCCLEEKDYHNRFGNILMELAADGPNEVVIADDNFMRFLKERYPTFKFVSSTTKCLIKPEEVRAELAKEDYHLVCLDYNLNHNFKFLDSLSDEEKNKAEFLANAVCHPACPNRKDHYYKNSQSHLSYGRTYHMGYCSIPAERKFIESYHLTYDLIKEKYIPNNFSYFKLEGRTWTEMDLAATICNYLVKPEYYSQVITYLMAKE